MEGQQQQQSFQWGACTDRGCVRMQNEDAYAVDLENGMVVVSDGIGGSERGAQASEIVVRMLPQMFANRMRALSSPTDEGLRSALRSAVSDLSDQLHAKTNGYSGCHSMGATVVAVVVRHALIHVVHMGDSRAYLLQAGQLKRLTADHSVVGILERRHELSPQAARHHGAAGQLTRFVGMPIPAIPDVSSVAVQGGDSVLLCTDGLTTTLEDETMAVILRRKLIPQEASRQLVDAAIAAGGPDNVTALVLDW
mgnify:CR=1 FL=1